MPSVLFLCTGNSCRSQMAEGWLRHLHPQIDAYSAGIVAHGQNPLAIKAMAMAGVDISSQQSQTTAELPLDEVDYVFTVCDNAAESCPVFPAKARIQHTPFDDPPKLAKDAASEEEALGHYVRVRDEIRQFVERIDDYLNETA